MIGCLIWFFPFVGLVLFEYIGLDPALGIVLGLFVSFWIYARFIHDDPGEPPTGPGQGGAL